MSQRKLGAAHALPDNPEWIEFPRSDGDASILPQNTQRVVDHEGHVNYMRPMLLDEGSSVNWRLGVAKELARRMGLPEGPTYALMSWPDGYQFYDHNKGPANSPRHDVYLCGSKHVNRFRSINEFIPHALWLMQDETLNRENCGCKYCAKKPQRTITDTLELPKHKRWSDSPHASPARRSRQQRESRVAKPKLYAAVRRAPKSVKLPTGPEQALAPERDSDIRGAHAGTEATTPRWHRKGELVWCALPHPIKGPGEGEDIQFWPGIVEDYNLKVETNPIVNGNHIATMEMNYTTLYERDPEPDPLVAPGQIHPPHGANGHGPQAEAPWTVRQYNVYDIKLLGVTHVFTVSDAQVLPYLAHVPNPELLSGVQGQLSHLMHNIPLAEMDSHLTKNFTFNPASVAPAESPDIALAQFQESVVPYVLAIQIAAELAAFWAPTDEWECKFSPPSKPTSISTPLPSAPKPSTPVVQSQSLHAVIMQSMANNAAFNSHRTNAPQHTDATDVSTDPSIMSPEAAQALKMRMLGTPPVSNVYSSHIVTQSRYQGLWWGAERIWTDELVRLKLARCQLSPSGGPTIYPPSGPSSDTIAYSQNNNFGDVSDQALLGSAEKGLFLRLEGIFVVDVSKEDGTTTKECRACGTLFELADAGWVDPHQPPEDQTKANGTPASEMPVDKGKGKERAVDVGQQNDESTPFLTMQDFAEPFAGQSISAGPSFMPGPSPMKPVPLPNPDPAIPIENTVAETISQTQPVKKPKKTLSGQLSHPTLSTPYKLPSPPDGSWFRPIHPPGHEVVLSLSLISGRYYPHLFQHPLMAPRVRQALANPPEQGGPFEYRHLLAMEGHMPGVYQSMDPTQWKPSRNVMFNEADAMARRNFTLLWEEIKATRLGQSLPAPGPSQTEPASQQQQAMEVDV